MAPEDSSGRKVHLGRLALIFYRRGASWTDFGNFLGALFHGGLTWQRGDPFHEMKCRHGSNGRHHAFLQALSTQGDPDFAYAGVSRPCLGYGKGDANKSPGIPVGDLENKARAWLLSIGKGRIFRALETSDSEGPTSEGHSRPTTSSERRQAIRASPLGLSSGDFLGG